MKPNPNTIMIGVPIHYDPTAQFMAAMMGMVHEFDGCKIELIVGDSHPDRARNRMAAKFLNSDKEWLLFLDADLAFSPADLWMLFEHDKPLVAGFYAKKNPGPAQWVGNAVGDGEPGADGLIELREAGTGCLLIHRQVFERLASECNHYIEDGGKTELVDYFASGVYRDPEFGRDRWLSEDWAFCFLARKAGYKIYGDPRVKLAHEGRILYPIINDS